MKFDGSAALVFICVAVLKHVRSSAFHVTQFRTGVIGSDGAIDQLHIEEMENGTDMGNPNPKYFAAIRSLYASFGLEVPFHNEDHANNILEFATWYANEMKLPATPYKVAAFSHDVMHPGTPNNKEKVEETFLPKVQEAFNSKKTLIEFASDVWQELQDSGKVDAKQMKIAFAHPWIPFEPADDIPALMVDRAPQEVLHAWVTSKMIDEHFLPKVQLVGKAKVLINILMTSIALQIMLGKARSEAAHVKAMCEDAFFGTFQCGLLLHLLDMGWFLQQQCVEDEICTKIPLLPGGTPNDPSYVFAPRFLAESKFYMKDTPDELEKGEQFFVKSVTDLLWNLAKFSEPEIGSRIGQLGKREAEAVMHALAQETDGEGRRWKTMSPKMLLTLTQSASLHRENLGKESFRDAIKTIVNKFGFPQAGWMKEDCADEAC